MSLSGSDDTTVPPEAIVGLTAVVTRVHTLEKQRRFIARMVFSQAHTLGGTKLLTLLYADQLIHKEEAALTA